MRPTGNVFLYLLASMAFLTSAPAATTELATEPALDGVATMPVKEPMHDNGIVRLSFIEVHPEYLDEYRKYASEVGELSLLQEPGVLTMYAMAERDNPCKITILETYASQEAYKKHTASPHFQKYKQGTLHMVKSLRLVDQEALNPANRLDNFITSK